LQRLADLSRFPQDNARSKPPCVDGALPQVGCVHCDTEALRLAHEVDVGRVLLDEGTHERAERQHVSACCACLVEGVPDELRCKTHSFVLGCDDGVLEGATGTSISVADVSGEHLVEAKLESEGSRVIPY
jgi:hypothetical protein